MKSTAISFGGMVFECLEVGIFETLLFNSNISIFLQSFELDCGWLQTKVVVCLLLYNLFLQTAWFDAGRPATTTNKEQRIAASKKQQATKKNSMGLLSMMLGLLVWC